MILLLDLDTSMLLVMKCLSIVINVISLNKLLTLRHWVNLCACLFCLIKYEVAEILHLASLFHQIIVEKILSTPLQQNHL